MFCAQMKGSGIVTSWMRRFYVVFMLGLFVLIVVSTQLIAQETYLDSFNMSQYKAYDEGAGANYGLEKQLLKQAYENYLSEHGGSVSDRQDFGQRGEGLDGFSGRYVIDSEGQVDVDEEEILQVESKKSKKGFSFGGMASRISKKKDGSAESDDLFFGRKKK